ncbi:MAG: putative transposase [Oleiphilaceae bacterium]|jgi:putative transposase
MARFPRLCLPGIPQHIIQRGTNRQVCFAAEEDFSVYASCLCESAEKNQVAIHAWVFMINHVYLLATPSTTDAIS